MGNKRKMFAKRLGLAATMLISSSVAGVFVWKFNAPTSDAIISSYLPPTEVTPEIVAMRGCIEGVAHPSEQELTAEEQFTACDNYVDLSEDRLEATYFRALEHYERGTTSFHHAKAHRDFSIVIAAGGDVPPAAFANRAWLNVRFADAPEDALSDIDMAIEATVDRPRPYYFERRAYILSALADKKYDRNLLVSALEDVETALSLAPESSRALRMRELLLTHLEPV